MIVPDHDGGDGFFGPDTTLGTETCGHLPKQRPSPDYSTFLHDRHDQRASPLIPRLLPG